MLIGVGDIVAPQQPDPKVQLLKCTDVRRPPDRLASRDQKIADGFDPEVSLLRVSGQAFTVLLKPVRVMGLQFGKRSPVELNERRRYDTS